MKALVKDDDMGRIELLLGQPTISGPGITMVVRNGKTYLKRDPDINELMKEISLDDNSTRPKALLAKDMILQPNSAE